MTKGTLSIKIMVTLPLRDVSDALWATLNQPWEVEQVEVIHMKDITREDAEHAVQRFRKNNAGIANTASWDGPLAL